MHSSYQYNIHVSLTLGGDKHMTMENLAVLTINREDVASTEEKAG
jgi:hypothetical protein